MKNKPLTLDVEVVEKKTLPETLGMAFNQANVLNTAPAGGPAEMAVEGGGTGFLQFLKPTLSNLFLLGCLLGLFVLYCCSCVIHALTFAFRGKSS
jgi:hypothetical protein